jgi:hypothetical protein
MNLFCEFSIRKCKSRDLFCERKKRKGRDVTFMTGEQSGGGCGCRASGAATGDWGSGHGCGTPRQKEKEKGKKNLHFFLVSISGAVGADVVGKVVGHCHCWSGLDRKKKIDAVFFFWYPYQVWSAHMWWAVVVVHYYCWLGMW